MRESSEEYFQKKVSYQGELPFSIDFKGGEIIGALVAGGA
jgi:hypothetical protein